MNQKQIQTIDDIEFRVALKAISYCRVSTDDQADYGTSLDKQKRVNAEYAAKNGIEIVERIPVVVESNEHNVSYLETKRTRLGHLL